VFFPRVLCVAFVFFCGEVLLPHYRAIVTTVTLCCYIVGIKSAV